MQSNRIIKISGNKRGEIERFRHLGSFLMSDEDLKDDLKPEIKSEWTKWRKVSGILYKQKISIKVKINFIRQWLDL